MLHATLPNVIQAQLRALLNNLSAAYNAMAAPPHTACAVRPPATAATPEYLDLVHDSVGARAVLLAHMGWGQTTSLPAHSHSRAV